MVIGRRYKDYGLEPVCTVVAKNSFGSGITQHTLVQAINMASMVAEAW